MRSRPKAAITTTVRSRPEPTSSAGTRFRRKAIRIEGDGEVMGTNGTARKPVGTAAPSRARFADWAKSHADQHQGQRDIRFRTNRSHDWGQANRLRDPKSEDTRSCHSRPTYRCAPSITITRSFLRLS